MSICYIQKKIGGIWRTVITVDSTESQQVLDHFCKQYCRYKFRISTSKANDLPAKPHGLSLDEALNALHDIQLVDLTWNQGREAFRQIVDIVEQVSKKMNG